MKFIPSVISFILLSAHFYRAGYIWVSFLFLIFPCIYFIRKKWPIYVSFLALLSGAAVWLYSAAVAVMDRMSEGDPWVRMLLILSAVAGFTVFSAFYLKKELKGERYNQIIDSPVPGAAAFILTAVFLSAAVLKVKFSLLIADRFLPGSGWIEIFLLSIYAAWLTEIMIKGGKYIKHRRNLWLAFSAVFFVQLILGLSGLEKFLMTGKLHLPIPALIVAGPIYRGSGLFMPVLLGSAIILTGPAWCSFLCYIGSWDLAAGMAGKRPGAAPPWRQKLRVGILAAVIIAAFALRAFGVSTVIAAVLALMFGIGGVAVMVFWSRKKGLMMHCISYCPVGVITTLLGKISPFRIFISGGCTKCGACAKVCRYDALKLEDGITRPGISCTLCGDCIGVCGESAIYYKFPGLPPEKSRALFIVLAVSIHAVFMGLARL